MSEDVPQGPTTAVVPSRLPDGTRPVEVAPASLEILVGPGSEGTPPFVHPAPFEQESAPDAGSGQAAPVAGVDGPVVVDERASNHEPRRAEVVEQAPGEHANPNEEGVDDGLAAPEAPVVAAEGNDDGDEPTADPSPEGFPHEAGGETGAPATDVVPMDSDTSAPAPIEADTSAPAPPEPAPPEPAPPEPAPIEAAPIEAASMDPAPLDSAKPGPATPEAEPAGAVVDDRMWDAVLVALAMEPPIPADVRPWVPHQSVVQGEAVAGSPAPRAVTGAESTESARVESEHSDADHWPVVVAAVSPAEDTPPDDWPVVTAAASPPDDWPVVIASASRPEDMSDEVADFWYPPEPPTDAGDIPPEPGPDPEPECRPEPVVPLPWSAEDDDGILGVRNLAADWEAGTWIEEPADAGSRGAGGGRPRAWRRVTAPVAGRWSALKRGERVNVVLYALTGVSIVAMALELLAGPDSLPTDVSTAPAPVVTVTTTRPQSTTITFTIPPAPVEDPSAAPPVTRSAATPPAVQTRPTTPAADPEPGPEPTAAPPVPTTPATSPPTTRATPPTTGSGFPEPTPPVLPTFPGPSITSPAPEP